MDGTGTPGIHSRCHSGAEARGFACCSDLREWIEMRMMIDQTGRHHASRRIYHTHCLFFYFGSDLHDPVIFREEICLPHISRLRIDQCSTCYQN